MERRLAAILATDVVGLRFGSAMPRAAHHRPARREFLLLRCLVFACACLMLTGNGAMAAEREVDLELVVPPENPVGRRNLGSSDRGWIPSSACTRPPFFSSFQHSATASVGAQPSSLNSLLFGISSPR